MTVPKNNQLGMLGDFAETVMVMLGRVRLSVVFVESRLYGVVEASPVAISMGSGGTDRIDVTLTFGVDSGLHAVVESRGRVATASASSPGGGSGGRVSSRLFFDVVPVLFTQGINEVHSVAQVMRDIVFSAPL